VGTNGKTSTSIYLGRLLAGRGVQTGVTISPHLRRWGERVQIAGSPVADEELAEEVALLHELAAALPQRDGLRLFDLLTIAAARLFASAGVETAVFEAGIGGRLDTTRVLRAPLVVLTGVALDHVELLGATTAEILREKLGVAPRGARVVAGGLGDELTALAEQIAAEAGLELELPALSGTWRDRNAQLAVVALGPCAVPDELDLSVPGRFEHRVVDRVEVILDTAHNPQGWATLAAELPQPFVAVVSIGADRPPTALAPVLERAVGVFATAAWQGRSLPAATLAAAVGGEAVADPGLAISLGLERARATGLPLVVFGSTYLLEHAYAALGL
jgi:dihydrofolate synthase/folylpolyglutamate synthase